MLPLASNRANVTCLASPTVTVSPSAIAVVAVSPRPYFSTKPVGSASNWYRLSSLEVAYTAQVSVSADLPPFLSTTMLSTLGTTSYTTVSALLVTVSVLVYSYRAPAYTPTAVMRTSLTCSKVSSVRLSPVIVILPVILPSVFSTVAAIPVGQLTVRSEISWGVF